MASIQPRLCLPDLVGGGVDPGTALRDWQQSLRYALWTILGVDADAVSHATPAWEIIDTVPGEGFVRHQIRYEGVLGGTGSAFVLVPGTMSDSVAPGSNVSPASWPCMGTGTCLARNW